VLVEQQLQLIESRASHLPVMLLIQVTERHGIREDLIQVVRAGPARILGVQSAWI
jgi:hypothetical protein